MLQNFTNLEVVSLSSVNISSSIPMNLSSSLRYVDLEATNFQGVRTERLFLLPNFKKLILDYNNLIKGVLPKIHPSSTLLELSIAGTDISGELPYSIGTLISLSHLNLHGCDFSGPIPDSIGNLTQIRELELADNHFTGHIPSTISNLKKLTRLDLSSNFFGGEIPNVLSNLPRDSNFNDSIPYFLGSMVKLFVLDLRRNNFTRSLPPLWGRSISMVTIILNGNRFEGSVHVSLLNSDGLEVLDVENNAINDMFPTCLGTLRELQISPELPHKKDSAGIDKPSLSGKVKPFSKNLLVRRIPQGLQFNTFENDSYGRNFDLCGPPLSKQCGTSDSSHVPRPLDSEEEGESYFFSGFTWE
ncbi:hypothetical protein HAX54_047917 [Datura stramonium]|uniref:Uncharacterized protein n=1 Tax=Datura stramonium TaxID=4076 RepID=A0ABS8ST14_DATST|nr:hypothetical protein [Datura stramonium]